MSRNFKTKLITEAYSAMPWDEILVDLASAGANVPITLPPVNAPPPGPIYVAVRDDDQANGHKVLFDRNGNNIRGLTETASLALVTEAEDMLFGWHGGGRGWGIRDGRVVHRAKIIATAQQVDFTSGAFVEVTLGATEYTPIGIQADTANNALIPLRDGLYTLRFRVPMTNMSDQKQGIGQLYIDDVQSVRIAKNANSKSAGSGAPFLADSDTLSLTAGELHAIRVWHDEGTNTPDTEYSAGLVYAMFEMESAL